MPMMTHVHTYSNVPSVPFSKTNKAYVDTLSLNKINKTEYINLKQ